MGRFVGAEVFDSSSQHSGYPLIAIPGPELFNHLLLNVRLRIFPQRIYSPNRGRELGEHGRIKCNGVVETGTRAIKREMFLYRCCSQSNCKTRDERGVFRMIRYADRDPEKIMQERDDPKIVVLLPSRIGGYTVEDRCLNGVEQIECLLNIADASDPGTQYHRPSERVDGFKKFLMVGLRRGDLVARGHERLDKSGAAAAKDGAEKVDFRLRTQMLKIRVEGCWSLQRPEPVIDPGLTPGEIYESTVWMDNLRSKDALKFGAVGTGIPSRHDQLSGPINVSSVAGTYLRNYVGGHAL